MTDPHAYDYCWSGPWVADHFPRRHRDQVKAEGIDWPKERLLVDGMDVIRSGSILVLCGQRGTGKTLYACQLAALSGRTAIYMTARGLMDAVKSWIDLPSAGRIMNQSILFRCPILVIDELHERIGTTFEDGELTHIIDKRYGANLPTMLISNLAPAQLQDNLGASIMSRVMEGGKILVFDWPTYRGRA